MTRKGDGPQARISIGRGSLRGRLVTFYDQPDLRPTPSRVRDAVFSMLREYAEDGYGFIDACSGSGVMGFSAYSTGFSPVWLFDSNGEVCHQLEQNAENLGAEVTIQRQSAHKLDKLALPAMTWICYADPPFRDKGFHQKLMTRLLDQEAYEPGSIYVAEHELPLTPPAGYTLLKQKKYGRTLITLLEKDTKVPELATP